LRDDEAKVWVATSDEVFGLATEAESIPELVQKLQRMLPEFLLENGQIESSDGLPEIPFCVMSQHIARASTH